MDDYKNNPVVNAEGFLSDPSRSRSLSGKHYWTDTVFAAERDAIFAKTWQYVCPVSRLTEKGKYVVADVAGDSIIVLRDASGDLQSFYNVCQHRGHHLLEGEGTLRSVITCPYHLWAYGLDGNLRTARGTDEIDGFDKSNICLTSIRVDVLAGLVFVNLDSNAVHLHNTYVGLEDDILSYAPNAAALNGVMRSDYDLAANWKISVENYSECYHCPNKHPSLSENALELSTYRIECKGMYHVHRTCGKGTAQGYVLDENAARGEDFASFFVWPNLAIEVYPGGYLTTFAHRPVDTTHTRQETEWLVPEASPTDEQKAAADFVHIVREEDIPLCESVQKGMQSRGYDRGYFVVDKDRTDISEHAVHDFQSKVIAALS